jgi:hypothetical protein
VANRDHDCPPPLQTLGSRGSLHSVLIAAKLVSEFSRPIKVARFALTPRAGEVF